MYILLCSTSLSMKEKVSNHEGQLKAGTSNLLDVKEDTKRSKLGEFPASQGYLCPYSWRNGRFRHLASSA